MKKSITILNRLISLGIINPVLYYSINVTVNKVQAQGRYNSDEIFRLRSKKIKWDYKLSESGFLVLKWKLIKFELEITFT